MDSFSVKGAHAVYNFAMRKTAFIVLVVLALGLPVPGKKVAPKPGIGQALTASDRFRQPTTRKARCLIEEDGTAIECEWQDAKTPSYGGRLLAAENLPNLLLVLVGIGGIGAALLTLRTVTRQADLQAAGMRQWLDVEALGAESGGYVGGQIEVQLRFEAVNNTPFVLTLQEIVTRLSHWPNEEEVFTISETVLMAPNRESKRSSYPFYIASRLIGKAAFERGTILTINGEVRFKHCFENEQVQWFTGLYKCAPDRFERLTPIGIVPDREVLRSEHGKHKTEPSQSPK